MKVYSLYDKDKTFLGAFPTRDFCITYAKVLHPDADGWDYDVIEEYLSKSPLLYNTPYIPPASSTTPTIHNVVKAEPYSNVRAYWEEN
jgi:hypothetical protein